jgi:hypothetical protein
MRFSNCDSIEAMSSYYDAASADCWDESFTGSVIKYEGYRFDNNDRSWATGFKITVRHSNGADTEYILGKDDNNRQIVSDGSYSVHGKPIGMQYCNFRYMRYFAFRYDEQNDDFFNRPVSDYSEDMMLIVGVWCVLAALVLITALNPYGKISLEKE